MSALPHLPFHTPTALECTLAAMEVRFGKVRRASRGKRWRIDIRPVAPGFIYGFERRKDAEAVLGTIRRAIGRGEGEERACAPFIPRHGVYWQVRHQYGRWLSEKDAQVALGDLSPRTVAEYRRYATQVRRDGTPGEIAWWSTRTIDEISKGSLQAWQLWLGERGAGPKTRRNVLGAFRVFVGWLVDHELLATAPAFPRISVPEYDPVTISERTQEAVLSTFTDPREWLSHAIAARCCLRPGEVRALSPVDYEVPDENGVPWLNVRRAMQGLGAGAPIGPTKGKRSGRLPLPDDLAHAIELLWPAPERMRADESVPLLTNPRTGARWTHWSLRESWMRGCKTAGVSVGLYEGTKHSGATALLGRTGDLELVRQVLRHRDLRSTQRYARVQSAAIVEVLRPKGKKR